MLTCLKNEYLATVMVRWFSLRLIYLESSRMSKERVLQQPKNFPLKGSVCAWKRRQHESLKCDCCRHVCKHSVSTTSRNTLVRPLLEASTVIPRALGNRALAGPLPMLQSEKGSLKKTHCDQNGFSLLSILS